MKAAPVVFWQEFPISEKLLLLCYNKNMDRLELKYQLLFARGRCAICKQPFSVVDSIDMHEAILTRGNVRGANINIMVPQNCVVVHHGRCHMDAQTSIGRRICVREILLFEGDSVLEWLSSNRDKVKSGVIDDMIRLVMEEKQ